MWQQLKERITELTGEYEQLLVLSKRKREVLVVVDFKALDAILKEEQRLVERIGSGERKRQQVLRELAKDHPDIHAGSRMQDLYNACPPHMAAELKRLHDRLGQLVKASVDAREANAFLVSAARSAVEYHLNILSDTRVNPVYGAKGNEQISKDKKFNFEA